METDTLRVRVISLRDPDQKDVKEPLFYIKKLLEKPSDNDHVIELQASAAVTDLVVSLNQTFDWCVYQGNYCQIIVLTKQSTIITDVIFWFNHLLDQITQQKLKRNTQSELPFNDQMVLEGGYRLEYSLQSVRKSLSTLSNPSAPNPKKPTYKALTQPPLRGHLMQLTQFNQPVYCALCEKFIWGFHDQGFECTQCSLVTHKKCHQNVPFWCRKSLNEEPNRSGDNLQLRFHIPHVFKKYGMPFLRALAPGNHGHCNHCGSQIFLNALKCSKCHFIIHTHCQDSVPPMCTISYNELAKILLKDINRIRFHFERNGEESNQCSIASSIDFSWLQPLPETEHSARMNLPRFRDFKCIGRLGNGASAQVYCVQHIMTKKYHAIKVADGTKEQARQQLEVEKQILFRYSHGNPYMIKAYCAFHEGTTLFLVMDLVEGGTLSNKLQTKRMSEDEIRFYLAQLICVIQYLHSKNIVYRDLKLEHSMIGSNGCICLVDFGLGRILKGPNDACHTFCGTYSYMAPEVRCLERGTCTQSYSFPVDFWALGIMLVQMLYGEQIDFNCEMFSNSHDGMGEWKNILEVVNLPSYTSPEARSLAAGLLEYDPEKRLGSPNSPHGSICDHRFFKVGRRIDWQAVEEGVFKPAHRTPPNLSHEVSNFSPLSHLPLDRGVQARAEWAAAGQTIGTPRASRRLKAFDYIDESSSFEFM